MNLLITKPVELSTRSTACPYCGGSGSINTKDAAGNDRQINCQCRGGGSPKLTTKG